MTNSTKTTEYGNTYVPVEHDCQHVDTYGNRESCAACAARYSAAGHAAGLGVGHVWTNIQCEAYRTMRPADCTCRAA